MEAPVVPAGILPGPAQDRSAGGAHGARPARALRAGASGVAAREKVAVPAQHGVRSDQQPQPAQHVHRQPVQQRCQERPVAGAEPHLLLSELPLQHRDPMAQGEDLDDLAPIAHRQQAQHRERVRHTEVSQSQQDGGSSCRVSRQRGESRGAISRSCNAPDLAHRLPPGRTSFGKRRADNTHRCRPDWDQTDLVGQGPTAEHLTITFRSTHVTGTPQSFEITGDLTIKSRTRPVTVHGRVNGDRMLRGWVITRRLESHTLRSWAYCGWPTRSGWSSE